MPEQIPLKELEFLLDEARPDQKRAITATDPLVVVSAGAGTGKTKTLASRFAWFLATDPECGPERILTLTFTEKAALEMRERIGSLLNEWGRKTAKTQPTLSFRLFEAASRLDEAYISTIHSFALRIVKECALFLDMDPSFRLVTPPEETLFWDSIQEAFDHLDSPRLERGLPSGWKDRASKLLGDAAFMDFLNLYTPESIVRLASQCASLHGSLGRSPEELWSWSEEKDATAFEAVSERLKESLVPAAVATLETWADLLVTLLPERGPKKTALEQNLQAFRDLWEGFPSLPEDPLFLFENLILETLKKIPSSGKFKEELEEALGEKLTDYRNERKKAALLSRSLREDLSDREKELRFLLLKTAALAWKSWDEYRRHNGLLTFGDMIDEASRALNTHPLYSQRFRHILVDEFQDTDPLQDRLVRRIWEGGGSSLFLVGDLKQSIYRFRNADPSLFSGYIEYAQTHPDLARYIPLCENFRTRDALLTEINKLFGSVWKRGLDGKGTLPYEEILPPKDVPWHGLRNTVTIKPLYEYFLIRNEGLQNQEETSGEEKDDPATGENINQARKRLAGHLARALKGLKGERIWDKDLGEKGGLRPATWQDMTVLVPTRTFYSPLEEVFAQEGIPAILQASQGYFTRGEIWDAIHFLKALSNLNDDLHLATFLFSPFSGLSLSQAEKLVFESPIKEPTNRSSLFQRLEESYPKTAQQLKEARKRGLMGGPASALSGLVSSGEALSFYPMESRQRVAVNLRQLVDIAREYEGAVGGGLFGCADYLKRTLQETLRRSTFSSIEEPEVLGENEDVVRVQTIHAAKGLEYPIVALFGLEWEKRDQGQKGKGYASKELGVVLKKWPAPASSGEPLSAKWQESLDRAEEIEETKRLFYVACTRAKDSLILCGLLSRDSEGNPKAPENTPLSFWQNIRERLPLLESPQEADTPKSVSEPLFFGGETPSGHPALSVKLDLQKSSKGMPRKFGATAYALLKWCPLAYRLKYRQGHDLAWELSGEDSLGGADLGSLTHWVLSHWDFDPSTLTKWLPDSEADCRRLADRISPELRPVLRDPLSRRTSKEWLEKLAFSLEGEALRRRLGNSPHEEGGLFPFSREVWFCVPFPFGTSLVGSIDALWEDEEAIHVRDWKITREETAPEELYQSQIEFYGAVVRANLVLQKTKPILLELFFLRNGELRPRLLLKSQEELTSEIEAVVRCSTAGPFTTNRERCSRCPWRMQCPRF